MSCQACCVSAGHGEEQHLFCLPETCVCGCSAEEREVSFCSWVLTLELLHLGGALRRSKELVRFCNSVEGFVWFFSRVFLTVLYEFIFLLCRAAAGRSCTSLQS